MYRHANGYHRVQGLHVYAPYELRVLPCAGSTSRQG